MLFTRNVFAGVILAYLGVSPLMGGTLAAEDRPPLEQAQTLVERGEFGKAVTLLRPYLDSSSALPMSVSNKCELVHLFASALQGTGKWGDSILVLKTIENLPFTQPRDEKSEQARLQVALGEAHTALKEFDKAAAYFDGALKLCKEVEPTNSLRHSSAKNSFAVLLMAQGKIDEAKALLREVERELSAPENVSSISRKILLSKCLGNLGLIHKNSGEIAEAAILYEKSVELRVDATGENHPVMVFPYYNLGMLYASTKEYAKAKGYVEKAVRIGATIWPKNEPHLVLMRKNLGTINKYLGK
jgi:tetratricopeptide (TPR) repeat protein